MSEDGSKKQSTWLKLGKVTGVFGVKGWLKIYANTDKKENILSYQPWYIEKNKTKQAVTLAAGKPHGKTIVALFEGVNDRNEAEDWIGCEIYIKPEQLPKLKGKQFYWNDLIGLRVVNLHNEDYGVIDQMIETGANDIVHVKGEVERLIPFVMDDVIKTVDVEAGKMIVDWDPDF